MEGKILDKKLPITMKLVIFGLCLLVLVLGVWALILANNTGFINSRQAYDIAYGHVSRLCMQAEGSDCSKLSVKIQTKPDTGISSTDELWSFVYSAPPLPDKNTYFDGTIQLDLAGEVMKQ
jgi:hypothetical protein